MKPPAASKSFFSSESVFLRALMVALLVLLLLIPLAMVSNLVNDRQYRSESVRAEVGESWSRPQIVEGPIMVVPYEEAVTRMNENNVQEIVTVRNHLMILPQEQNIAGQVDTEERKRGIYTSTVYTGEITLSGSFAMPDLSGFDNVSLEWDRAFITIGVSDVRGIVEAIDIDWDGGQLTFDPGMGDSPMGGMVDPEAAYIDNSVGGKGIHARIPGLPDALADGSPFSTRLQLKGSQSLHFSPIGETTTARITSNWTKPSFAGSFLPTHDVTDQGFTADWRVLHYNRDYPQIWSGNRYAPSLNSFGVRLLPAVTHYLKAQRSAKYGILILALTFLSFFFVELLLKKKMNLFQYVLVGLALVLFYSLLLAFSEQIGFNPAYLVAAVMTIGLVALYVKAVYKSSQVMLYMGGLLTVLYGFIYILLQLEDFALLIGSIALFVILAIVMYFSLRIDWDGGDAAKVVAAE